jgi:hypothetical protein
MSFSETPRSFKYSATLRARSFPSSWLVASLPRGSRRTGNQVPQADADQQGRNRVTADQAGQIFSHAAEAFLLQITAAGLQRFGDVFAGLAHGALMRKTLTHGTGQRSHAAADGTEGAFGLFAGSRGPIAGRIGRRRGRVFRAVDDIGRNVAGLLGDTRGRLFGPVDDAAGHVAGLVRYAARGVLYVPLYFAHALVATRDVRGVRHDRNSFEVS